MNTLIPSAKNVKSITDLRENANKMIENVQTDGQYYIFYRNKPKAIFMSLDKYNDLLHSIEELQDLVSIKALDKKKIEKKDFMTLEEFEKSIKK